LLYRSATSNPKAVETDAVGRGRPFAFWPALALAGVLTVVLLAARWGADVLGSGGALLAAGAAGFADVHAAVLAVATLAAGGSVSTQTALVASGLAFAANTISKCVLAFAAGGRAFGTRFTAFLVAPAGAVAAGLVIALR
jgi:uncharacterized membrane protein (DUF4010 family)